MKKLLVITAVILGSTSMQAQIFLDSTQINRIAKTCQLWGHLNFFHPYLSDNTINWEKAFTDNIGSIIESTNKDEFRTAIQKMLLVLNDPVTKINELDEYGEASDSVRYPAISYQKDSILLVSIRDYQDLEDFNYSTAQFNSLRAKILNSNGIIFDLRNETVLTNELKGFLAYYFPIIESHITKQELTLPGFKSRFHDGFMPESGRSSGGYASGFYVKDPKRIYPSSESKTNKIAFIVNSSSELPRLALALQQIGQAYILSEGELSDGILVNSVNYKIEEGVSVQIRLDELSFENEIVADYLLTNETEDKEVYGIASEFIKGTRQSKKEWTKKIIEVENQTDDSAEKSFYPNLENRLLALAKIWTVIDYFFAYKDLISHDWGKVLHEFVPRFINASDSMEYFLTVSEMYAHIEDGHGFIQSEMRDVYFGEASPPIRVRFIEGKPVVVHITPDSLFQVTDIKVGDVITHVDNRDIYELMKERSKYVSASNKVTQKDYLAWRLLNGSDSSMVELTYRNKMGKIRTTKLPRNKVYFRNHITWDQGRQDMPMTELISKDIGYADLNRLTPNQVKQMFEDFKNTKAIIFDMRGYPNGTAWTIAPYLTNSKKRVPAAQFRRYSPMAMKIGEYPEERVTTFQQSLPSKKEPHYAGLTVMLINERTQSQAEHTGLFFETANNTKFIGSQTAGANGDVTNFKIPGNITLSFSGHDVRHIDGRQLQKIGLVPDIEIKPTIKGIRNGKDEVLEKAIKYLNSKINE